MHTIQIPQDLEQQLIKLATQHDLSLNAFILQSLQNVVEQHAVSLPEVELLSGLERALEVVRAQRSTVRRTSDVQDSETPSHKYRQAGTLKGMFTMAEDFDDPLDDLQDYM